MTASGDAARPESTGRWHNRGDTVIYDSEWVRLATADVLLPDGTQVDHHVVRVPRTAAGTIVERAGAVLLLWRHRFITDTWGWEIPAGRVDPGESPADAAARETLEETGWLPQSVTPLCSFHPANGLVEQTFHIFTSRDAERVGEPTDVNEAARVEWLTIADVRSALLEGRVTEGLSFGALGFAFAAGAL